VFEGEEELVVKVYNDAIFQIDVNDSKSQSSFVLCLNGGGGRELEKFQARYCNKFDDIG
jgi:hypothetical protein